MSTYTCVQVHTHGAAKRAMKCLPGDDLEFQLLPAYAGAIYSAGPNAQLARFLNRKSRRQCTIIGRSKKARGRPQTARLTAGERTIKCPKFVISIFWCGAAETPRGYGSGLLLQLPVAWH